MTAAVLILAAACIALFAITLAIAASVDDLHHRLDKLERLRGCDLRDAADQQRILLDILERAHRLNSAL